MEQIPLVRILDKDFLLYFVERMPEADLSPCFMNNHIQYGEIDKDGEPIYLFDMCDHGVFMHMYIAYINIKYRELSRGLMIGVKELAKNMGCESVTLNTTNSKSSYRRWMEKCGFEPSLITFKMEIK